MLRNLSRAAMNKGWQDHNILADRGAVHQSRIRSSIRSMKAGKMHPDRKGKQKRVLSHSSIISTNGDKNGVRWLMIAGPFTPGKSRIHSIVALTL